MPSASDAPERLRGGGDRALLVYWISSGGSICQNDVVAMSRLLGPFKRQPKVALFLKSDGGNPEAALRLVHLLRNKFDRITLLAPFECASAALKHDLSPVDHHNYLVAVSQGRGDANPPALEGAKEREKSVS